MGHIILPRRRSFFPSVKSWADWGELSQNTLNTNQGGAEDTWVCFEDDTIAGTNEVGRGVVSGANLVLTQAGNVAGATGTPPSRYFDETDDYMSMLQPLTDMLAGLKIWSVIIKFEDLDAAAGANPNIFNINGASDGNDIQCLYNNATLALTINVSADGNADLAASPVNVAPGNTVFYFWVCSDGTNTYAGWSLTKPLVHRDVAANNRVQAAASSGFGSAGFETGRKLMSRHDGASRAKGKVRYLIISKASPPLVTY